jgi:hypothetical protein
MKCDGVEHWECVNEAPTLLLYAGGQEGHTLAMITDRQFQLRLKVAIVAVVVTRAWVQCCVVDRDVLSKTARHQNERDT